MCSRSAPTKGGGRLQRGAEAFLGMAARADEVDSSGSPCWAFPLAELNPRSEWTKVGEGSFGNVYKASLLGVPVAVKEAASCKESRLDGIRRDIFYLRCAACVASLR